MKNALKFFTLLFCIIVLVSSCKDDDESPCTETTWYEDADGDGLGNPDISQTACDQPTGYVADNTDTDDTPCSLSTWYQDADGDGLGNPDASLEACEQPVGYVADNTDTDDSGTAYTVKVVDPDLFLTNGSTYTITTVNCTLSNGTATTCYEITTNGVPSDHDMGPWCPTNISDGAEAGGIWLEGGEVYDVDGAFIENMATFYGDDTWLMYDANGDIKITETEDDCANAANPNVGAEYENFCVECLPSYVTDLTQTYLIPTTPVTVDNPISFAMGPMGGVSVRGLAFNGIRFDAPAPTDAILGAYTLAPFDDAGGHINLAAGYHYHAATGITTQIAQTDGHAPMIGYALDGHAIYAYLDDDGNEPTDLDACRGHYDEVRGYHYHVDKAGNNNFINCLNGAYAN